MNQFNKREDFDKIIFSNYSGGVNRQSAIQYFLNDATLEEREEFLVHFPVYIEEQLKGESCDLDERAELMIEVGCLYDDPFPILALFTNFEDTLSGDKYCYNKKFKSYEFYYDLLCQMKSYFEGCSIEKFGILTSLRTYRKERDFEKQKKGFFHEFENIDQDVLKEAYDLYINEKKQFLQNPNYSFFSTSIDSEGVNYVPYTVYRYAYAYALNYLHMSVEESERVFTDQFFKPAQRFCKIADPKDVVSIKKLIVSFRTMSSYFEPRLWSLCLFKNSDKEDMLKEAFDYALESLEKDAKVAQDNYEMEVERFKRKSFVDQVDFEDFLTSPCKTIKEYCEIKGITVHVFHKALSYMGEEIQEQVENKKKQTHAQRYAVVTEKVKKMKDQILHGVLLENNTVRPFDYLDYKLSTKLDEKSFKQFISSTSSNVEIRAIYDFFAKNRFRGNIRIEQILNGKTIFNVHGEAHEVSMEEKLVTIEFLKEHHLVQGSVVDDKLYSVALRRCVNGTLFDVKEDYNSMVKKISSSSNKE